MTLLEATDYFYYNTTLSELRLMNKNLIDADITYNSLLYLDLISYRENCTVSYLADVLHIAKSSVTQKVGELIKKGLVIKTRSEQDKRVYYLSINEEVAKQYRAYDRYQEHALERMRQRYSQQELDAFCEQIVAFSNFYMEGINNA